MMPNQEKNSQSVLTQKNKLIAEYTVTPQDIEELIAIIEQPNPNSGIINNEFMPKLILPVLVATTNKFVFLPPNIRYEGKETSEIPGHSNWKWIPARLSAEDNDEYILSQKLGNGTAWEQGLQIHGQKSAPEWNTLVEYLKDFSVSDPNYPSDHDRVPIIPSIIYPPPQIRRRFAQYTGDMFTGSPLELLVARRHEESHVIEMMLTPWPTGSDQIDGLPNNGAKTFLNLLGDFGVDIFHMPELQDLLHSMVDSQIFPRSYLGEFQAYLGDFIFLANYLGRNSATFDNIISAEKIRTKTLWSLRPQRLPKNYFGMMVAHEVVRTIQVPQATSLLNAVYATMKSGGYKSKSFEN